MPEESQESQEELERERRRRESEELANFEQRAKWWSGHYGDGDSDEAAERLRKAAEHADRMPPEPSE